MAAIKGELKKHAYNDTTKYNAHNNARTHLLWAGHAIFVSPENDSRYNGISLPRFLLLL